MADFVDGFLQTAPEQKLPVGRFPRMLRAKPLEGGNRLTPGWVGLAENESQPRREEINADHGQGPPCGGARADRPQDFPRKPLVASGLERLGWKLLIGNDFDLPPKSDAKAEGKVIEGRPIHLSHGQDL